MKAPIQTIVATPRGSSQLKSLKVLTGIKNWNTIMRWAVCVSLREESTPPPIGKDTKESITDQQESTGNTAKKIKSDEVVSVNWHIFAGEYDQEISAVFWMRYQLELSTGSTIDTTEYFKRHLQRGLNILEATIPRRQTSLSLLQLAITSEKNLSMPNS